MAATATIGGDELARMRGKGEIQGKRESERESARGPGEVRGVVGGLQQRAGKQEVAGAC